MKQNTPTQSESVTLADLLAEVRGIDATQQARFDGIEREQSSMREWMGRLSDAIDRQVNITAKFIGLEVKQGQLESQISDIKLDLQSTNEKVSTIKESNIRAQLVIGGISAFVSSFATAILIALAIKFLGLGGSAH